MVAKDVSTQRAIEKMDEGNYLLVLTRCVQRHEVGTRYLTFLYLMMHSDFDDYGTFGSFTVHRAFISA